MSRRLVVERDVMVPMADGTGLATDIYRNGGSGPWPVLLQRVAYDKERSAIANGALEIRRALERGYAMCVQDVRGRFRSGGTFDPFRNEGADGADTIAWLSAASWTVGPIAMFGRSYSGALQWAAADELAARHQLDLLGALSPCMAGWNVPQRWLLRDGVFQLGFVAWWVAAHLAPSDLIRRYGPSAGPGVLAGGIDQLFWTLDPCSDPLYSLPHLEEWLQMGRAARSGSLQPGGSPRYGGSPQPAGSPVSHRRADVPALHTAGWYDVFLADTIAGFSELAAVRPDHHHLVVGPWAHGGAMTGHFAERSYGLAAGADAFDLTGLQLDWFDRWLGGDRARLRHRGASPVPIRSFLTGRDRWVELEEWPPADTAVLSLFLVVGAAGNTTLFDVAPSTAATWTFHYDPAVPTPTIGGCTFLPGLEVAANAGPRDQRPLLARPDGLSYQTEPLASPLEVVGTARLSVEVQVDDDVAASMLVVGISDVFEGGRVELIAQGAQQFRTPPTDRDGGGIGRNRSALPDQVHTTTVTVGVGPLQHYFDVGHRLCVHLAAASYPAYDRLAATGGAQRAIDVTVSSTPERPAVLRLPIVVLAPNA